MKILVFSDLHGDLHKIKLLVEKAKNEKADVLLCAGDLTFFGSSLEELVKKFNLGIPLVIIPGNHEFPEDIKKIAKKHDFVKNIHSDSFMLDSCNFIGMGGSKITPFSTPFEIDDRTIGKKLSKFRKRKAEKMILVTHEPPLNTALDYVGGLHLGSSAIRNFIEKMQPDFCICGHFHENAGKEEKVGKTVVMNPNSKGHMIEV